MIFTKISDTDLADKGVVGLPDVPNLSTLEMQEKFDELVTDVVVPKFNELSGELDNLNTDEIPHSVDITDFKLDSDGKLQVSTDGGASFNAAGSSGHLIMDGSGATYPSRSRLQFSQNVVIKDFDENNGNKTFLSIAGQKGDKGDSATIRVGNVQSGPIPEVQNVGSSQDAILNFTFPQGADGQAASIQVGTVQSGKVASVSNRGTSSEAILDFTLPKGEKGDPGTGLTLLDIYPTLSALQTAHPVGQRGDAYIVGNTASNTTYLWSTTKNAWEDVGALKGAKGDKGDTATVTVGTVTSGSTTSVQNVGTSTDAIFNFTLQKGAKGDKGDAGTISIGTVTSGANASVVNVGTPESSILNFEIPKGDKGDKGDPQTINGKGGTSINLYATDIEVSDTDYTKLSDVVADVVTAQGDISTLQTDVTDLQTGLTSLEDVVAPVWDVASTYEVNQYVRHEGSLWKCLVQNTGITPVEGTSWTEVKVGNEISALNTNFTQKIGDFAFRVNPSTNKNEISNDGGQTWSNFSGGFDEPSVILSKPYNQDTSCTIPQDCDTMIFVVNTTVAGTNLPPNPNLKLNGVSQDYITSIGSQTYSNNVWGRVGTWVYLLKDIKNGDKLTFSLGNNYGSYCAIGQ